MWWPSLRAWSYHCTFWVHQEQSWGCILMKTLMKWWITFFWNQALVDPWNNLKRLQKQLTVFLTSWLSWFANVGNIAKANQGYSSHSWWTSQVPAFVCQQPCRARKCRQMMNGRRQVMCNWFSKQRAANQHFTLLFCLVFSGQGFKTLYSWFTNFVSGSGFLVGDVFATLQCFKNHNQKTRSFMQVGNVPVRVVSAIIHRTMRQTRNMME